MQFIVSNPLRDNLTYQGQNDIHSNIHVLI